MAATLKQCCVYSMLLQVASENIKGAAATARDYGSSAAHEAKENLRGAAQTAQVCGALLWQKGR
jgi:hypothetical protein